MVPYPEICRPVFNTESYAEVKAYSTRLTKPQRNRKVKPNIEETVNLFFKTYFKRGVFAEDTIMFNSFKAAEWVSHRRDANKILNELGTYLNCGFETMPVNSANIHNKLESLNKIFETTNSHDQDVIRLIVWMDKGIQALFADVFQRAKKRMKYYLKNKFLYTDGHTPWEVSRKLNSIGKRRGMKFIDNDFSKFDSSLDDHGLDIQFKIYAMLGIDPVLLDFYRTVHYKWRFKGSETSGDQHAKRMTGQPDTAFGNAICNMVGHLWLINSLGDDCSFYFFVGDDSLIGATKEVDTVFESERLTERTNYISKMRCNPDGATFCNFVAYDTPDGLALGPDVYRLAKKFELTNGQSLPTEENLEMRRLSYCFLLGNGPESRAIATSLGYNEDLPGWHDLTATIHASAIIHGMEVGDVMQAYENLISQLSSNKTFDHKFIIWENSKWQ
jgi:hypothetical protein